MGRQVFAQMHAQVAGVLQLPDKEKGPTLLIFARGNPFRTADSCRGQGLEH